MSRGLLRMKGPLWRGLLVTWALAVVPSWAAAQAAAPSGAPPAAAAMSGDGVAWSPSKDPLERVNRAVFRFNEVLDQAVVKPVAQAYAAVVPGPVRLGVGNALGNVSDAWSAVNLVLQGRGTRAAEMTMRVGINTVLGLGGLLDIATEAGLERQTEDFGQTLGRWGVSAGPYIVLPLFGPSTVRDAVGLSLDTVYTSAVYPSDAPQKWRWMALRLADTRVETLPFTRMLDTLALDKYTFVRDAYLSRRLYLIYDGNPPSADEDGVPKAVPTAPQSEH